MSTTSPLMKRLFETTKTNTVILGPLQRMLMGGDEFDDHRRRDVIHPSELIKKDFCDLALYYRLIGWDIPKENHGFQLETIFEQGHAYHDKWQGWVWDLGTLDLPQVGLRGRFRCLRCGHGDWEETKPWFTTSPTVCVNCGAGRKFLQYGEVPIWMPKHRIGGHSDGDLDLGPDVPIEQHPMLEVKSVGEGTVRFEAPKLITKHTKTVVIGETEKRWTDWQALWRDVRRPFRTHLKQGALYCFAMGRAEMIYIYEFKPTGASKEFRVRMDFDIIEEELETALDVLYAVKTRKPPDCPRGGCKQCRAFEALRDGGHDDEEGESEEGPEAGEDPDSGTGTREAEDEGTEPSSSARGRDARGSRGRHRPLGRRSDGGTSRAHRVDELPEQPTRTRGDRGRVRRDRVEPHQDRAPHPSRTAAQGRDDDRDESPRRVVRRRPRS